jgi:hypothetical protein
MTEHEVDLRRDTSDFLVEIRTVLSRAETALSGIGDDPKYYFVKPTPVFGEPVPYTYKVRSETRTTTSRGEFLGYSDGVSIPHPGAAEAIAALKDLVTRLEPFRRVGRKKSS